MLTGDKLETATCIAKSSHLVSRSQDIHVFKPVRCVYILSPPCVSMRRHKAFVSSQLIIFYGSQTGLKQRRGPSGAQRLQKEAWLCSGHLRRLLRGTATQHSHTSSLSRGCWACGQTRSERIKSLSRPKQIWKSSHSWDWSLLFYFDAKEVKEITILLKLYMSALFAGVFAILRAWVCGAGVSVSSCGLLPLLTYSEGPDCHPPAAAHRQQNLRHRWVLTGSKSKGFIFFSVENFSEVEREILECVKQSHTNI